MPDGHGKKPLEFRLMSFHPEYLKEKLQEIAHRQFLNKRYRQEFYW